MKTVETSPIETDVREIVQAYPKDWAQRMADDSVAFYEALIQLLASEGLKPTAVRFHIEMDGE